VELEDAMKPAVRGIHHVKIPVSDLEISRVFYERLFNLTVLMEFRDADGVIRGVAYRPLDGVSYALREDPERAKALAGYDPVAFAVDDDAAVDDWVAHLNSLGISNSGALPGTAGSVVGFDDPDGIKVVLYSRPSRAEGLAGRKGSGEAQ
jgi:catechol 2,3-dioxygenase-like lactoylglutathione lyase family enzyme